MTYIIKISSHNPKVSFVWNDRKYDKHQFNQIQSINVKTLPKGFLQLIQKIPLNEEEKKAVKWFIYDLHEIRKDCAHFMQILEHTGSKQMDFGNGKKEVRSHRKIFEMFF